MIFFKQCKKSFQSLINRYKLEIIAIKEENAYSIRYIETVRLKNKVAGLEVIFEKREQMIFVDIYKLVNCEFPSDTSHLQNNKELYNKKGEFINGFDIFDLIALYHPELVFSLSTRSKRNSVKKILDNYAITIDKCAGDILNGDFSIFPKLTKIVEKRRQELKG